ncbi:MAG: MlaD family protein [Alistipes sp.]|jgi:hypothetical protein|uniref:MlaD family protein n=1 Tax=Alistipes sp. TaxID=1872444 RepID=UPI001DA91E24|nr:MlaD family protein [Alistipes sp.]MBS6099393.1 MCE family protein [Alistipes sp.]HJI20390.1 MCE family protein [Rikenellaceae bacterium]
MRREVKIGIFAVGMIACLWAGIRFLSGIDIFSRNTDYYAAYDQINGVQPASPIMIRGVKVGTVTGISFDPAVSDNVVLRFSIKRQYRIPVNSEAKIFSNGIMGSKAIEILLGDADRFLVKGDTLRTSRDRDLMDVAGSELEFFKQKVSTVVADLSQTLGAINGLIETNAASVRGTLAHLNSISGSVDGLLAAERDNLQLALRSLTAFSDMLGSNTGRMDSVIRNVNDFTGRLADSDLTGELERTLAELNATIERINAGDGTLGRLVNDPQLYESLDRATGDLSALLVDLRENPRRYVHFSLIGGGERKARKERERLEARKAEEARQAAEVLRACDSLAQPEPENR